MMSPSASSSASSEKEAAEHKRRWKLQSPLGLLLVGVGASLLGHATLKKKDAEDGQGSTWSWIATGTASLIALNAGLSLFGDAVKHRTVYEMESRES